MKATIQNGKLIIEIDLQKPMPSKTGKTLVVASSFGNIATTAIVDGKPVVVGLSPRYCRNFGRRISRHNPFDRLP